MARRNLSLFKKTTVEPEIVDEDPTPLETETDNGLIRYTTTPAWMRRPRILSNHLRPQKPNVGPNWKG